MKIRSKEGRTVAQFDLIKSHAKENIGFNSAVGYAKAEKDVDVSVALGFSVVGGDAGLSVGGLVSGVGGNAGLNIAPVYADSRNVQDYTIGKALGRFSKYVPRFISEIAIPAVSVSAWNRVRDTKNAFVLGFYNDITDKGGDYIALGLLNRVRAEDGKSRWQPFFSGNVSIDGIIYHNKKEKTSDSDNQQREDLVCVQG